jgi:hypothetical protein
MTMAVNYYSNNQTYGTSYNNVSIDTSYSERMRDSLTMHAGGSEMLRIDKDGFYVRGVKVPVDDKEAETVYNAFKAFLIWAEFNRR